MNRSKKQKIATATVLRRWPLISGLHPHFQKLLLLSLLTFVSYFSARVEFLLWNHPQFQNKAWTDILLAFIVGARFDLCTTAAVLIIPFFLSLIPWGQGRFENIWRWLTGLSFLLLQWPLLLLNYVDNEMINIVGRRFTSDTLFILREAQGGQLGGLLQTYWKLYLINGILSLSFLFASIWILRLDLYNSDVHSPKAKMPFWKSALQSFVLFALILIASRGGLQSKPITYVHANVFAAPMLNNMILNTSFTIAKSFNQEKLSRVKFFANPEEMRSLLNENLGAASSDSLAANTAGTAVKTQKRPNIVIIIVESLALEYMGRSLPSGVDQRASTVQENLNWTPFLNQLAEKSIFFENAFANGRRSIEGIAAVVAGIPALMTEPFVSSSFSSNYFVGLGTSLVGMGYQTSFFHGGNNGTMYFDTFTKSAGFNQYFGSSQYPNKADHDGAWGIYDGPFLQFMKTELDKQTEPFFSTVFTLSSHNPYRIPTALQAKFKNGPIEILKSISYADDSIKEFFQAAQSAPWFDNTIFIITADHTQLHFRPEFQNDAGDYRIPLMIYSPKIPLPTNVDRFQFVQQIDIPVSVLDLLGQSPKEKVLLARSVFQPGPKFISNYTEGRLLLFDKDAEVSWSYSGSSSDSELKILRPNSLSESEKAKRLNILKAHIQYFSMGLWDNVLYYPTGR